MFWYMLFCSAQNDCNFVLIRYTDLFLKSVFNTVIRWKMHFPTYIAYFFIFQKEFHPVPAVRFFESFR